MGNADGGGGACLPMPSQRLAAAYITSLLDVSAPSSPDSADTGKTNAALTYLTQTRGLTTKTLRKYEYGVGRGYYNFPSSDPNSTARYVREECVTFPWIMRASEVNEQEELREPPGRFDWDEEDEEEEENEEEGPSEDAMEAKGQGDGDALLSQARGPWTTRRIKARSLNHKGHQRLDPPGGGWG